MYFRNMQLVWTLQERISKECALSLRENFELGTFKQYLTVNIMGILGVHALHYGMDMGFQGITGGMFWLKKMGDVFGCQVYRVWTCWTWDG